MGCKAQLLPDSPITVVVSPSTSCCNGIIKPVANFPINMVEVDSSILRGKVVCGNTTTAVPGAIVVASYVDSAGVTHYFVGVTNANGEYIICVQTPAAGAADITYTVQAYRCCCVNNPSPVDCTCS